MATVKDMKKKEYCDEVLSELAFMIQNVHDLREHAGRMLGAGSELALMHDRHLAEIADYLDWKLQVLTTACPFEWKGMGDGVQDVVSVRQPDLNGPDFSGGYVGG
jgi:hypothetical protein